MVRVFWGSCAMVVKECSILKAQGCNPLLQIPHVTYLLHVLWPCAGWFSWFFWGWDLSYHTPPPSPTLYLSFIFFSFPNTNSSDFSLFDKSHILMWVFLFECYLFGLLQIGSHFLWNPNKFVSRYCPWHYHRPAVLPCPTVYKPLQITNIHIYIHIDQHYIPMHTFTFLPQHFTSNISAQHHFQWKSTQGGSSQIKPNQGPPMHLHCPLKSVISLDQKLSAVEGHR